MNIIQDNLNYIYEINCSNCVKKDVCKFQDDFTKAKQIKLEGINPISPVKVNVTCNSFVKGNNFDYWKKGFGDSAVWCNTNNNDGDPK